jgi:integrase
MGLTDISVKSLKLPKSGQRFYADENLKGFGVRVSQGGTKTFVLVHGPRRERITIGRYPIISLAEARTEARRRLAEITLGKARPKAIGFDDARDNFLIACEAKNRQRTVRDYRRLLKHFPFGRTQLAQITRRDISDRLDRLKKTPSEANHAMVAIKVFFRWVERQGYLEGNPCGTLKAKQVSSSRERTLSDDELTKLFVLAQQEPYPYGPIVCLLALTGQRRGEIASLRWSWIDADEKIISLPADITKNRRVHNFPYGELTANVLGKIPRIDDLLFPASRTHVRGKPTTVYNGWPKAKVSFDRKLHGVSSYILHDLRRTYSSQLAALGTPIHVTEKLLNHVSGTLSGVAGVYNRYSYANEMRTAVEVYEKRLRKLAALANPQIP